MTESLGEELRVLCEQMLETAEKEERALAAGDLLELEACVSLKEEIAKRLREVEYEKSRNEPSVYRDEIASLLEQVTRRHERVRGSIETMLGECQQAIMEMRTGVRAHRAYYRAHRKGREQSTRLL